MAEQVGTTFNFDMPVDEIIELALEGLGGEHISHKEAKLARTALNLIFIDIQNEGFAPLASLELQEVTVVSGSAQAYPFGADTFNLMDVVVNVSNTSTQNTDLPMNRITQSDWLEIPTKDTLGRPTQYFIDRQVDQPYVTVWPKPDSGKYKLKAWALKKIADVNRSYQLVDLPTRYLPAIIMGLRYYMAFLRPGTPLEEKIALRQEYMDLLESAFEEDRERVDFNIYPAYKNQLGS